MRRHCSRVGPHQPPLYATKILLRGSEAPTILRPFPQAPLPLNSYSCPIALPQGPHSLTSPALVCVPRTPRPRICLKATIRLTRLPSHPWPCVPLSFGFNAPLPLPSITPTSLQKPPCVRLQRTPSKVGTPSGGWSSERDGEWLEVTQGLLVEFPLHQVRPHLLTPNPRHGAAFHSHCAVRAETPRLHGPTQFPCTSL